MQQINELSGILNEYFKWNKARMDCFVGMFIALLKTRTINLSELATVFPGDASLDSCYRRIQRFISSYHIDFNVVAYFIMALFDFLGSHYFLTVDRRY